MTQRLTLEGAEGTGWSYWLQSYSFSSLDRTLVCLRLTDKLGLPRWPKWKRNLCQCRRHKRCGFDPWVGKIPWRRAWQPTPVLLLGESHGQMSLAGYRPQGPRVRHNWSDLACAQPTNCISMCSLECLPLQPWLSSLCDIRITNPTGEVVKSPDAEFRAHRIGVEPKNLHF